MRDAATMRVAWHRTIKRPSLRAHSAVELRIPPERILANP